jgi:hypothetical protein
MSEEFLNKLIANFAEKIIESKKTQKWCKILEKKTVNKNNMCSKTLLQTWGRIKNIAHNKT